MVIHVGQIRADAADGIIKISRGLRFRRLRRVVTARTWCGEHGDNQPYAEPESQTDDQELEPRMPSSGTCRVAINHGGPRPNQRSVKRASRWFQRAPSGATAPVVATPHPPLYPDGARTLLVRSSVTTTQYIAAGAGRESGKGGRGLKFLADNLLVARRHSSTGHERIRC
jgi:hypothetical protein